MEPAAIAPLEAAAANTAQLTTAAALQPSFTSTQTTITVEKIPAPIAPSLTNKATVGENGLKLQDFNAPNHLNNKTIIFSQEDLEEFAKGKIAKVFGEEYAPIDQYARRVMLPMHPYLLVSRVEALC